MLPGKKYTPDDFLKIAWTRKWLLIIPALVITAGTAIWAYQLPNRYRSTTSILVVPQRVPEDYVRPAVTAAIQERLQVISQQILTRTRLEGIIEEFNLYQAERGTLIMEDVIEQMRTRDIRIDVLPARRGDDARAFTVSYESPNPRTAMQIAERLTSLIIRENLEDREVLADSTNQFLESQLVEARQRLIDQERKLELFRRQHSGRLPSQVQSNLQMIQNAQSQLSALRDSTNRDRDRIAFLERMIADAAATAAAAPADPQSASGEGVGSAAAQLEAARAGLRGLELRFTPAHPDIARAKRLIAELEARAEAEALQQPLDTSTTLTATPADRAARNRVNEMRAEMEQAMRRIEASKAEEARLQQVITSYNARVEVAPALESELTEVMRDYETLQQAYMTLLAKSEESRVAANLERRQIGEQFRILEPARLPLRPISPDRPRLNLMGLLAGIAFGLGLVALLEYRDTTLKTDDDVVMSLALPVLAVIPAMVTAAERAQVRRRKTLAVFASAALVLGTVGVAAWKLRLFDGLVR
jgi:polysaccharide chain length determinant protein (PEP-CTERM system associated)